jgi:hypothetical protein
VTANLSNLNTEKHDKSWLSCFSVFCWLIDVFAGPTAWRRYGRRMSPSSLPDGTEMLSAPERDLIRRGFCVRFGIPPRLADGFLLRVWRSGPLAG